MKLSNGKKVLTGLLVVGAAATGTVVAQAGDGIERQLTDQQVRAGQTQPPVAQVDQRQRDAFAILRRPRRADDALTASARRQTGTTFGQNADLARAIQTPNGKGWVIPGQDELCLSVPDGEHLTVSCNTTATARQGAAVSTLTRPDTSVVKLFGLLPDGTSDVKVSFGDGSERSVRLTDGVLSEIVNDPRELSFVTPDGQRRAHDVTPITEAGLTVDCGNGRFADAATPDDIPTACG